MNAIEQDIIARAAILQARQRIYPYRRSKQVQLAFEDLANALWREESKLAGMYYPFLSDLGAWGYLGAPSIRPVSLERIPTKVSLTPLGSGLSQVVFQKVVAEEEAPIAENLRGIARRAMQVRR